MRYVLIFVFLFFFKGALSQHFSLEDLIVLNTKNELQLSGYLQRYHWKRHAPLNDIETSSQQAFFIKKMGESSSSLEIIKFTRFYHLNDSSLELIMLDSSRWQGLISEAGILFNSVYSHLDFNSRHIDVYSNSDYTFLFFRNTPEPAGRTRYHVSVYNRSTYEALLRRQIFEEFWGQ